MEQSPKTLIQIHYHNRTGGVMRVVNGYAQAFFDIMKGDVTNILICKDYEKIQTNKIKIIDIPECDYSDPNANYDDLKGVLICKLKTIFDSDQVSFPALVIGHNLNLCKNVALTSAFAELSCQYENIRFFSVMHDFAEEGRCEMLNKIYELQKTNVNVKDDLYCKNVPVKIVVPGINAFEILKKCGFNPSLLPDPIFVSNNENTPDKNTIKNCLQKYANENGLVFDSEQSVFSYPVRIIPRKNILETIAFVTILNTGNLLTGFYGTSLRSKSIFNYAKKIVNEFKLPVIFNVFEVIKEIWNLEPTKILCTVSDFVVSSSVMEGFGYALYEPWFYGCGVIGRVPQGGSGYSKTVDTSYMYRRFLVPVDWVSVKLLCEKYWYKYNKYYPKQGLLNFLDSIDVNKTVDFGLLDEKMQFELLQNVLKDSKMKDTWKCLLDKELSGWPRMNVVSSPNYGIISRNMKKIIGEFSYSNFQKLFYTSFVEPLEINFSDGNYSCILDEFSANGLWLLT